MPSSQNPLGVKGVWESGLVPVPAVIASAVDDALSSGNVRITDVPLSPSTILELLHNR